MLSIGLDVHWRQSSICILDEQGKKVKEQTIQGPWEEVLKELGRIKQPFAICYEATNGSGWLYDRLSKMARRVVVAHPGQLRLIFRSKRKNDRVDAAKLAMLLLMGQVPTVHVPNLGVRAWRSLIEFRTRLVQRRAAVKNMIRALLKSVGQQGPRGLWTTKGLAWLKELAWPTVCQGLQRDMLLEELAELSEKIRKLERELNRIGRNHPGVRLLRTIPGVGARTSEAVVAYIDDARRFGHNKAIGAYFGVVPCQDSSAGKDRLGHITCQGAATVRRLVTEASWQAIRRSPTVKAYFNRIVGADRDRRKIALVATAHYLLRVMLAMLGSGQEWRESVAA
jgi:transposase